MRNASKDVTSVRLIPTLTLTSRPSGAPESKQSLHSWAIAGDLNGRAGRPIGQAGPRVVAGCQQRCDSELTPAEGTE